MRVTTGRGGESVTVFYADTFFFLNLSLNYLLLAAAGRLAGEGLCRLRCLLGAGLGAGYALLVVTGPSPVPGHPVCQAGAAVIMLLAAFGRSDRLLRVGGLFLLLACALGGGLLALGMRGGQGMVTAALLGYGALSVLLDGQFRHTRSAGELKRLTLYREGRRLKLTALADTGNTLRDPLNGQPVVIAEGRRLTALFPELSALDKDALSRPIECLERLRELSPGLRVRLLPYRAVGTASGLLVAVQTDRLLCEGQPCPGRLVALSPTPLSDGGGYCALVSANEGMKK